jgi:alpha-mannosidase
MAAPVIHLIPHTHWDREWYLPLGGFRARLVRLIDDLIDQLQHDPGLPGFLLDGQTALLEDYLGMRPERRSLVNQLVQQGRISTGPWYILADEQIPSGEALLRNLQLGRKDCERLGRSLRVLYSPDAFGHPGALPALGLEFGLRHAVVWRGLGPGATGGKDLAWWRAPDGTRVLVYHLPPDGYEIGSNLLVADDALAGAWTRVRSQLLPRAATRHVAVFVGADHHAAAPDLGRLASRLGQVDRKCEFRLSRLDEFFAAAQADLGRAAEFTGELRDSYGYTWTLQGTLATRAGLKRRSARTELALVRVAEPLAALDGLRHGAGETPLLEQAWREVVQSHFHDTICGCSSDLVAKAAGVRFDNAAAATAEVISAAIQRLTGQDPDRARERGARGPLLTLWNGAARPRGGVVIAEASFFVRDVLVGPPGSRLPRRGKGFQPFVLRDPDGGGITAVQLLSIAPALERRDAPRHYPDQDEVERVRFAFPMSPSVPGLGFRHLEPVAGRREPLEEFVAAGRNSLWNGRMRVELETAGTLAIEDLGSGARHGGLFRIESERDRGDTYSFCPVRGDRPVVGRGARQRKVEAAGPLVAALSWRGGFSAGEGEIRGRGRVSWRTEVELAGDSPALRIRLTVENQARDHRLRVRFPLGLPRVAALAGAQFGQVERGVIRPGRPRGEWPVPTAPAHRWVAAARGQRGLAVFAPGFMEYEWTRAGDLLVTILRSVGELSREDLASRPGNAGWPVAVPLAQSLGEETVEFGVAPIGESDLAEAARLERIWEDLFVPPEVHYERDATRLPVAPVPSVELDGEGLVFSACQPGPEAGTLDLRCYNSSSVAVEGRWRLSLPVAGAMRVRASGEKVAEAGVRLRGGAIEFRAGARELVTVRLTVAAGGSGGGSQTAAS